MATKRSVIERTTRLLCWIKRGRRIRPSDMPVKINLGCGLAVAQTWINIDGSLNALIASWPARFHQLFYRLSGANQYYELEAYCDLLKNHRFVHHDLSYGIPIGDGCVDFVYTSHFLEHLRKTEADELLREAHRVLRKGGTLRVCVPDLAVAVDLYCKSRKEEMLDNYFFVEHSESSFSRHRYMYDFELLKHRLEQVGFTAIKRCSYRQGATPDLTALDNRPEDTLFVEATKGSCFGSEDGATPPRQMT